VGYRWIPRSAVYGPHTEHVGVSGRFDNGLRLTFYVASTPEGALAEYLRRNPEYLNDQDILDIRVFELKFDVVVSALDLSTHEKSSRVGIQFERLRSSDLDEHARYAECRLLADEVEARGVGILYPSAALRDRATNLACLGPQSSVAWRISTYEEVALPRVDPSLVTPLQPNSLIESGTQPHPVTRRHPNRPRRRRQ
jgi:hypothetical protein